MALVEKLQADQRDKLRACAETIRDTLIGLEAEYLAKRAPLERLLRGLEETLATIGEQNPPTDARSDSGTRTRPFSFTPHVWNCTCPRCIEFGISQLDEGGATIAPRATLKP